MGKERSRKTFFERQQLTKTRRLKELDDREAINHEIHHLLSEDSVLFSAQEPHQDMSIPDSDEQILFSLDPDILSVMIEESDKANYSRFPYGLTRNQYSRRISLYSLESSNSVEDDYSEESRP
ncbi:hypothetical protein HYW39_01565 [Candidatus Curtissbacteria bacterium]|nr:hypothetical protein [Candidatus Curtissbacteria bacterium]